MAYVVQADIEARVSAAVVRQILDDDASGAADAANVNRVIADAESYVEGFLRGIYDIAALRVQGTGAPNEVKRLCLDVAVSYLYERWPEYIRGNWQELRERARMELKDLRNGVTRLDVVGAPEPARNQGGVVRSGDPDSPTPVAKVFLDRDGMGIY